MFSRSIVGVVDWVLYEGEENEIRALAIGQYQSFLLPHWFMLHSAIMSQSA